MGLQGIGTPLATYYRGSHTLTADPLFSDHGHAPTVLVADDEAIVRTVLRSMLERLGCTVTLADCAAEAINIYESNYGSIDIVLFDLYLPDMLGDVLYAQLRLINPDIHAVLITGNCESDLLPEVVAAGVDGILGKPFDVHQLLGELTRVLAA